MRTFPLRNIRAQLTLWNILVFGGILVVYAFGTSWFFLSTLNHQLDSTLKEDLELVDQMLVHMPDEGLGIDTHEDDTGKLERFLEIWTTNGLLLHRSKTLGERALGDAPDSAELRDGLVPRSIVFPDGTHLRVAAKLHLASGRPTLIRLAVNEADYFADIHKFVVMLIIGIPLAVLLIALSAYWMARNALTPVDLMASRAHRISGLELKERIPIKNPHDELGRLAGAFNELLERVERSFDRLKRFTSDASHELRTPLTAMRSVGEVGLQTAHTSEEYREVIGSMLEESTRLTRLVDSLLFLSRADSGKHVMQFEQIDLLSFARETAGLLTILAEEKEQNLTVEGQPGVVVAADRSLLSQTLLNLVDNAIKFTPTRGMIAVSVGSISANQGYLDVIDSGPGIPPAERERIFERFYTLPTNNSAGTGLGLAIARWAVEALHGSVRVESRSDSGTVFRITLPQTSNNLKHS
jgi:heavy metal sensor kinase